MEGAVRIMATGPRTTHEEHAAFGPHLHRIEALADAIGELTPAELRSRLEEVDDFLAHTLMPHAVAEGRVLFPLLRAESGEPTIGVRMTQCHVQLGKLLDELEGLIPTLDRPGGRAESERQLRRVLYSIHALLTAHLAETDQDVQPLLEAALPEPERRALFEAVEACAREVADLYE
jgi:iron-sulfur cluster repair protein YtfE (RIC family)